METKRILIAGLLMVSLYVAWSLFFAPQPEAPAQDTSPLQKDSLVGPKKEPLSNGFVAGCMDIAALNYNEKATGDDGSCVYQALSLVEFSVVRKNFFKASLSTKNGGTFIQYSLPGYLGDYSSKKTISRGGVGYDSDLPFGFLFDKGDGLPESWLGCNPCIEGLSPIKSVRALHNGVEVVSNQTVELLEDIEELVFEIVLEDGTKINHSMIFNDQEYAVRHTYSGLPDTEHLVVWKNGIAPSERFAWEDDNNSCAGYVDVNGDEAWNEQALNHNELTSLKSPVAWAGVRNKFFIASVVPLSNNEGAFLTPSQGSLEAPQSIKDQYLNGFGRKKGEDALVPFMHDVKIQFSRSSSISFDTFLAPLDYSVIRSYEGVVGEQAGYDLGMTKIMTLGFWPLSEISKFISLALQFLYGLVGFAGYGLILIIFAVAVRLVSGPLTKRSLQATQKMQTVQPLIKDIQEKYKSDPKKMQAKIMQTYKENNVNPLSGCLLMFLQWPIMVPPFIVFRSAVELRSESFLWIKDLSQPDYLIYLPIDIPWLGTGEGWTGIGILPLLMGFTLYLTMKKTMANAQGQNKMMMYTMNTMFVLLFNSFPAGLNLYYVCYNVLNYLQQRGTSSEGPPSPSLFAKLKGLLQKQKK